MSRSPCSVTTIWTNTTTNLLSIFWSLITWHFSLHFYSLKFDIGQRLSARLNDVWHTLPFPTALHQCKRRSPTSLSVPLESVYPTGPGALSRRPLPRTDFRSMKLWTSFAKDIDDVIQVSMAKKGLRPGTRLTVGNIFSVPTLVSNEDKLRSHVSLELNAAVEGVLAALGIEGEFSLPGSSNAALVGDPDFLWVEKGGMQPKLLVHVHLLCPFNYADHFFCLGGTYNALGSWSQGSSSCTF